MKRIPIYIIAVVCAVACGSHTHEDDEAHAFADEHHHDTDEVQLTPEQQERMGIASEVVTSTTFSGIIKVAGTIISSPSDEWAIVAPASGQVVINGSVVEGAHITAGQVLFVIDTEALTTTSAAVEARLRLDAAQQRLDRARTLFDNQLITQREMDDATIEYNAAQTAYAATTRHGAGRVSVLSRQTGWVANCQVRTGDYVEAGTTLATLRRGNSMMLVAEVPERHFERLDDITSARFKTSYSTQVLDIDSLNGRLVARETVSQGGGYLRVTFAFDAPATSTSNNIHDTPVRLIAGCYADVWLTLRQCHDALCVPIQALVREGDLYFVFVQEDEDCFEKREVTLADNDGTMVEIVSGIQRGESVVTRGAAQLSIAAAAAVIPAHNHNH